MGVTMARIEAALIVVRLLVNHTKASIVQISLLSLFLGAVLALTSLRG